MTDLRIPQPDISPTTLPDPRPSTPAEALEWLGGTVEEVVEGLRARGIKGKRANPGSCPLYHYLRIWWLDVGVGRTIYHADNFPLTGISTPVWDMPSVLSAFVAKFDAGAFPDLID